MTAPPRDRSPLSVVRLGWLVIGLLCVGVGGVGMVVPGLPTTVFFIAAAACFSRSSPRLEAWVLGLRGIGPLVRDYRAGLGMPRRVKVVASSFVVLFVGLSVWTTLGRVVLAGVIAGAGLVGLAVIWWRVPTREVVLAEQTAG